MRYYLILSSFRMISSFTAVILIFSCYQLTFITAPDSPDEDADAGLFWNGPSAQNDANAYVQYVQSFWTDERTGAANPRSMSIEDNDAKSFRSGGEINRSRNILLFCTRNMTSVLIF